MRMLAILANDSEMEIEVINHGWQGGHYRTTFQCDEFAAVSRFVSEFHTQEACPTPDQRYAFDMELLDTLCFHTWGLPCIDLKECSP